jgi:hypothetical protein
MRRILVLMAVLAAFSAGCSDDEEPGADDTDETEVPSTADDGTDDTEGDGEDSSPTSTFEDVGTPIPPPEDIEAIEAGEEYCAAAEEFRQVITPLNDDMEMVLDAAGQPGSEPSDDALAALDRVRDAMGNVDAAYTDLAAAAPAELVGSIETVQAATAELFEEIAAAEDLAAVAVAVTSLDPEVQQAASDAVLVIDQVTAEDCGFSLAE